MILVAGDLMVDVLLLSELRASEQSRGILIRGGGSAANTAAWAARLGAEVVFVGCVGDDAPGEILVAELQAADVRIEIRAVSGMETGAVAVEVTDSGERLMRSARGANEALGIGDLRGLAVENLTAVHLTGYALLGPAGLPLLAAAGELATEQGALLSFDPSSPGVIERVGRERLLDAMVSAGVGLLLPNAEEAVELTGAASVMAAACALGKIVPTVIVKTGATGAMYCADGESGVVAIESLAAIDTTGAGDAFNAGMLIARLRGEAPEAACRFAHSVASQTIGRYGGRPPEGE